MGNQISFSSNDTIHFTSNDKVAFGCPPTATCGHCTASVPASVEVLFDNLSDGTCGSGSCTSHNTSFQCDWYTETGGACYWRYVFPSTGDCGAKAVWVIHDGVFVKAYISPNDPTDFSQSSLLAIYQILAVTAGDCPTWSSLGLSYVGGDCADGDVGNPHCFLTAG